MVDDNENAAPDPWADLGGQEGGDENGDFGFAFDPVESTEPTGDDVSLDESPLHESDAPADAFVPSDEIALTADGDSAQEAPAESNSHASGESDETFDDIAEWLSAPATPGTGTTPSSEAADAPAASMIDGASIQIGTGESGLSAESGSLPFSEGARSADDGEQLADWPVADGWPAESSSAAAEEEGDAFGIGDAAAVAGFAAAAGGAVAESFSAPVAPAPASAAKRPRKSLGGAVGAILGGLLSVPIVLLILLGVFWGTGRDPIGFRSWLPGFLLPAAARRGANEPMPRIHASSSLDSLSQDGPETGEAEIVDSDMAEPSMTERPAIDESSAPEEASPDMLADSGAPSEDDAEVISDSMLDEPPLLGDAPEPDVPSPLVADASVPEVNSLEPEKPAPVVSEPPPLDLSGLEAAIEAASASTDTVLATPLDAPDRRKHLIDWYKSLARVGEEMAMLESVAAESGRPLAEPPPSVRDLYGRIAAADAVAVDLKRLCRNWVDFAKRPADGVMLVGEFVSTRRVGPYWHTAIAIELADGTRREVNVISRRAPLADGGERVVVAGVVFSGDVVWAADCGRLEAAAGDEELPF